MCLFTRAIRTGFEIPKDRPKMRYRITTTVNTPTPLASGGVRAPRRPAATITVALTAVLTARMAGLLEESVDSLPTMALPMIMETDMSAATMPATQTSSLASRSRKYLCQEYHP